jgi:hypothetical protein
MAVFSKFLFSSMEKGLLNSIVYLFPFFVFFNGNSGELSRMVHRDFLDLLAPCLITLLDRSKDESFPPKRRQQHGTERCGKISAKSPAATR